MSRTIDEDEPLKGVIHPATPCKNHSSEFTLAYREGCSCGHCFMATPSVQKSVVDHRMNDGPSIKSRAEFYQVALREEGEALEALHKAEAALATAQEAYRDASAQLTLTRDGLFKACGL